MNIYFSPTDTS